MIDALYVLPMVLAAVVSLALVSIAWNHRKTTGATWLLPLLLAVAVWSLAAAFEIMADTVAGKYFWGRVEYLGIAPIGVLWFLFILDYCGFRRRITGRYIATLLVVPSITIVLVWTNDLHGWMWRAEQLMISGRPSQLQQAYGPWFWVGAAFYSWFFMALGVLLLIRRFLASTSFRRGQVGILILAAAIPMTANSLYLAGMSPVDYIDPTPLSFALACLLMIWGLFYYRLFDLTPVAYEAVFNALGEMVFVLDSQNRVTEINPAALREVGTTAAKVIGLPIEVAFATWPEFVKALPSIDGPAESTLNDAKTPGREVEIRTYPLPDWRGHASGRIVMWRDVTAREQYQRQIEAAAFRDFLTGLPNRRALHDIAEGALRMAQRRSWSVALLFLDLDRFKSVNDALGHAAGDYLLQMVSARLRASVRGEDTLSRLGGDEFALLMQDCSPESARRAGLRLLDSLAEPFEVKETRLHIEGSVGIALYPQAGKTVDELLAQADVAMYQSKSSGKTVSFYDESQDLFTQEQLRLESEFRQGIKEDQMLVEYQPLLDLRSRNFVGVEALVRWNHPKRGRMEPSEFLSVVEERSLTWALDRFVLQRAIADLASFDLGIAVNLSTKSLLDTELLRIVEDNLVKYSIDPTRLTLEVTERAIAAPEGTGPLLRRLREIGVQIAADDFGTGYSSLAYLRHFPLTHLKLDRSVVQGIGHRREDEAIIEAIITIARSLDLKVIAEGVESNEQLDWLIDRDCDYAQGYLIARPVSIEDIRDGLVLGGLSSSTRLSSPGRASTPPRL